MDRKDAYVLSISWLLFTGYIFLTRHHPFFWDTIQLASEHASWFYQENFSTILLPDSMDSGHIPFLGFYLAIIWKIFGCSISISHWAMLPWVLGIVYQLWFLVKLLIPEKWTVPAFIILISNPVLLSQCGLISPDVLLVFFFLLAIRSIYLHRKWLLAIAITGMVISSLRGMMLSLGLFVFAIIFQYGESGKKHLVSIFRQNFFTWLPAGLTTFFYLGWHFYTKGWIGYHSDSPWAQSFETVKISFLFRNLLILAWRLIDFGNISFWLCLLFLVIYGFHFRNRFSGTTSSLILLWLAIFVFLAPSMVLYKGLLNHRYLLPLYIVLGFIVLHLLYTNSNSKGIKTWISIILWIGIITGNFWKYPDGIATGWDSTLAHWPWFHVREQVMNEIKTEKINPLNVGTDFPELAVQEYILPGSGSWKFVAIDTSKNKYILWSNIMNGFPTQDLQHIRTFWKKKMVWQSGVIQTILYQNPRQ